MERLNIKDEILSGEPKYRIRDSKGISYTIT